MTQSTTDPLRAGSAGRARPGGRGWRPRREQALAVLAGWALGVASVLVWAVLSGGWYEYHMAESASQAQELVNAQGWEPVSGSDELYLRRPRVRVHGIQGPVLPESAPRPTAAATRSEPPPRTAAGPSQQPLSLAGTVAVSTTDPFDLVEGSYRVEWSATAPPTRTCFFRARLRAVGDERAGTEVVSKVVGTGQTEAGLAFVRSPATGQYYLDLTPVAGERCQWTMTLLPQ